MMVYYNPEKFKEMLKKKLLKEGKYRFLDMF